MVQVWLAEDKLPPFQVLRRTGRGVGFAARDSHFQTKYSVFGAYCGAGIQLWGFGHCLPHYEFPLWTAAPPPEKVGQILLLKMADFSLASSFLCVVY